MHVVEVLLDQHVVLPQNIDHSLRMHQADCHLLNTRAKLMSSQVEEKPKPTGLRGIMSYRVCVLSRLVCSHLHLQLSLYITGLFRL